jgi:hypothetical protein
MYRGSCHCGAVRFEIDVEIDHVRVCDCSVCRRRGGLMFRVPAEAFRLLTPRDALHVYHWGSQTAEDHVCKACGILPFRKPSQPTADEIAAGSRPFSGWSINVRCIDDIDLDALPIVRIAGSRLVI